MRRYRWANPQAWLMWRIQGASRPELHNFVVLLARKVDDDAIQDLFQKDMDNDGYFEEGEE